MINAQIVADSKNEFGNRLTTMVVTMPRIILAEFNTHRMFSRNSASSRAIPFAKMVKSVEDNLFIPIAWQKDHRGMQGAEYLSGTEAEYAENEWIVASLRAIDIAKGLSLSYGVTKQLCNRLLEPFMWHTVIVSATEWENFFCLRCPDYRTELSDEDDKIWGGVFSKKEAIKSYNNDGKIKFPALDDTLGWLKLNRGQAEIHMMALAEAMLDAYNESTPRLLRAGEWHIPFEDKIDKDQLHEAFEPSNPDDFNEMNEDWKRLKIKISTVMAARTSYTVVGEDQKPLSYQRMLEIDTQLINANPVHASPMEHCAECAGDSGSYYNLNGFKSRRFLLGK